MCFTELSEEEKQALLDLARRSIHHGLETGTPTKVNTAEFSDRLQQQAATFITLDIDGQLRGCIGTLQAYQPLVNDVAEHAFDAAFKDPRFPPLRADEEALLDLHISILTPAEPMSFSSQEDLIRQLTPGEDGLILEAGYNRGTFLPSVWESLPEPQDFLNHLKLKAGLPSSFWSDDIKVSRYRTVAIP
jgi:AmmeMemoRadiSam system protein A